MSKQAKLTLDINSDDKPINIVGEFSDAEVDLLLRYEQFVCELAKVDLLKDGGPGGLTINYNKDLGFNFSTNLPSDDKISALLHRLRPFFLKKEGTNFYRILNILSKNFDNNHFRHFLKSVRSYYKGEKISGMIQITANNTSLNSDEFLNDWLNAYEYHRDEDKREKISKVNKVFPFEATRALLIMMVYDKVGAINIIAHIIRVISGKQKSFRMKLQ